jgi:hypothetical protein
VVERAIRSRPRTSGSTKAGARANGIADPFNGHIDEFRISQARPQRERPKSTKAPSRHRLRSDLGDPEKAEVVDPQLLAGKHHGR